jgi:hypothetical protein
LGFCANEYVAIGLYSASIAVSDVSLGLNIAALAKLVEGTKQAGQVANRMLEDDEKVNLSAFCTNTGVISVTYTDVQIALARKNVQDAEVAKIAAETLVNADNERINDCIAGIDVERGNEVELVGGGTCPGTTYGSTCSFYDYWLKYDAFNTKRANLYSTLYTAKHEQAEIEAEILRRTAELGALTPGSPEHQAKQAELDALNDQLAAKVIEVVDAQEALNDAIALLSDPATVVNSMCLAPVGTLGCAEKFQSLCGGTGGAYETIKNTISGVTIKNIAYDNWMSLQRKTELLKIAQDNYTLMLRAPPLIPSCDAAAASVNEEVAVWTISEAVEVLRKVDKRSILQ